MGSPAVKVDRVECGNGKSKLVVREREYDVISWANLKIVTAVIITIISVVSGILFTYYKAEADQIDRLSDQEKCIGIQAQRLDDNDRRLNAIFVQFNKALDSQQTTFNKTINTVVRIDTRQEVLIMSVKNLDSKIDDLSLFPYSTPRRKISFEKDH